MEKLAQQIKKLLRYPMDGSWPKDWVLRLLSVLFAVFLWYFVAGEDKVDTNLLVPVEIVNLPRDLVISNQFKKQLEVSVSGPRGLIDGLRRQQLTRSVNLAEAKPGTMVIHNDSESIPFPRGITVLRLQPTNITLLIDRLMEKNLPIQAQVTGTPAVGFELAAVQFEPAVLNVSGPQALLGDLQQLQTAPLDISGLSEPVIRQVPLLLDPALQKLIGETVVSAWIAIQEKTGESKIDKLPVILNGQREDFTYTLASRTVQVTARVPLSLRRQPAALAERLWVALEVGGLPAGSHTLKPTVSADEAITILTVTPAEITVKISPRPAAKP